MFVVAGVSGNVGSVVAAELLAAGEKVKVLVRDAAKGAPWSKKGAEVAVANLDDAKALTAALKGAEGFFTLLPPNPASKDVFGDQRKMADAIAAAVKEAKVPHVVILSSIGADQSEGTGPIKGLHYLEEVLKKTGTVLTAVRAGGFQENVHNAVGAAKGAGIYPNMAGSADYPVPMIATRDIGALAAHELRFPSAKSDAVDLHGPAYSARQVAEKLGQKLGKSLKVVDVPPEGQVGAMVQAGLGQAMAESLAEMNRFFAAGKAKPVGERFKQGRTTIDTVIAKIS